MDTTVLNRVPPQPRTPARQQPTPPLRRGDRRVLGGLNARPEPFKPYDYERARRRRRGYAWGGMAVAVLGLSLLVFEAQLPGSGRPEAPPVEVVVAAPVVEPPAPQLVVAALPAEPPPPQVVAPPPLPPREVVTIGSSGSNLRAWPSLSGQVLWTAPRGTRLLVGEEDGIWVRVRTPGGERSGWMHRSVLADRPG
jgi:hypothetical protein